MITFFRKALSSWLVLGLLGLVMIAFIITGVAGPSGTGGVPSGGGETIAKVGGESIGAADIRRRAQDGLANARQQTPTLDMAAYRQRRRARSDGRPDISPPARWSCGRARRASPPATSSSMARSPASPRSTGRPASSIATR